MTKKRFCFATFPSSNMKSPLVTLSGHVLGIVDRIFQILDTYAEESYGQSPRRILHNMLQNNESIFGLVPDASSCASTSNREQSSSSSKGDSSSSCPKQKLLFEDPTREASVSESQETASADSRESVEPCEDAEMPTSSAGDKMDAEMQANPKETPETNEDINALIERNLVQIKSVSIIKKSVDNDSIGVEIDIDLPCMPEGSSLERSEDNSSPSKKTYSPGKAEKICDSPSRGVKSTNNPSTTSESRPTVDYSDRNILDFLAERLLSIFVCRKTCMQRIHDCFKQFQKDVRDFFNTINNIKFVGDYLPMKNEPYATTDLIKLRDDLTNKCHQMSEEAQSLVKGVEKDVGVLGKCLDEIDTFEKEYVPSLSNKGESALNVKDLKKIELRLKEICRNADGTVILKDGRREILLKSSSDFDFLVKHFVKFLIITGLLQPSLDHSQTVEDN